MLFLGNLYAFRNPRVTLAATSIDISKRLMKRGTERSTIALCGAISIFGHYDRGKIHCRTHFPVELLFTYIDNARFLLHDCRELHLIPLHQSTV